MVTVRRNHTINNSVLAYRACVSNAWSHSLPTPLGGRSARPSRLSWQTYRDGVKGR